MAKEFENIIDNLVVRDLPGQVSDAKIDRDRKRLGSVAKDERYLKRVQKGPNTKYWPFKTDSVLISQKDAEAALDVRNYILKNKGFVSNTESMAIALYGRSPAGKPLNRRGTERALVLALDTFPELKNFRFATDAYPNIDVKKFKYLEMVSKSFADYKTNPMREEALASLLPDNMIMNYDLSPSTVRGMKGKGREKGFFNLRGKSFLWADDLSMYDVIFELPFYIPLYGDHISLFPITAGFAMFFYTKMSGTQQMQPTQPGMPNMKLIMYIIPFSIIIFFNNFASGLSLYYTISNILTILIMLTIKNFIIDEKKVLASIEERKKQPATENRFQRRLRKMKEMMDEAEKKQVYTDLFKIEIIDFLKNHDLNFQLYVSADVFVYLGDLSELFKLIKTRNGSSGILAFSTENKEGSGFQLEESGRYSHSTKYIQQLANEFGYEIINYSLEKIRKNKNRFILGGLYIMRF